MISPVRGSEYAVAWNYVETMRPHCDLTVLYGSAGPHMGDVDDFEAPNFIDRSPQGDVAFHFVAQPRVAGWLNAFNRRGILTYSFYLAYRMWHRAALTAARRLVAAGKFDLVHFVGPIGYREPGYLWKLRLPYVWGPIGGATSFPWRLRAALPAKGRLRLIARTFGNALQLRFVPRIGRALRRADFLFTATTENQAIFARLKRVPSTYLPENGIEGAISLDERKFPVEMMRIAWIGSLEARKGLSLLLEALARVRRKDAVRVDIIGDGPLREDLERLAENLEIDGRLVWHGRIPRAQVLELLDDANLHVITGLNEANTTSVWEALGRSVPVLALDHCGMHDVVRSPYGIRVPVTDIAGTVQGITDALDGLIDAPERLEAMARTCVIECERFRTAHRSKIVLAAYTSAIQRYQARKPAR